jgi:ATP-dependent protease Clp ATPase subunit
VAGEAAISLLGQEVEKVTPHLTRRHRQKLNPDDVEDSDVLTLNTHALFFMFINAFKELNARLEKLESGPR